MRTNCPNRALFIEGSDPYPQEGEECHEQYPQEEVCNIDQEVEEEDDSLACIQVMRKLFVQPSKEHPLRTTIFYTC